MQPEIYLNTFRVMNTKNGIEDLKKAQFYLNDLIEWMESD